MKISLCFIGIHNYGEWDTITTKEDVNCIPGIKQKRQCSICKRMQVRTLPSPSDHVFTKWKHSDVGQVTRADSGSVIGHASKQECHCTKCGKVEQEMIKIML